MRTILILCGRYLPGYKDGGPVRSIKNLTDRLGDEYDFKIITLDRDHGDKTAYPNIIKEAWNQVGKASVWYVKPGGFTVDLLEKNAKSADVIYICGCFNDYARIMLKLHKKGKIQARVVVAAMGLFAEGAFHIKHTKKRAYILLMKLSGCLKNIEWSATSENEIRDIQREIGKNTVCLLAEDIPRQITNLAEPAVKQDRLRILFLSRISREKNLEFAIEIMETIKGRVEFDIYGPIADDAYFEECMRWAKRLPENIAVSYKGEVPSEHVPEIFAQYQAFLFPTLGENYGHVIYEAMASGCIPIISDRTPWGKIEQYGAGYVVSLERKEKFSEVVQKLTELSESECLKRQKQAMAYAQKYVRDVDCNGYRNIMG